ncbi:MAG: primosomal protein N' [Brumimicrobium sp.]|nr:primosomal protein N' [Brumimicrobium sp.]
MPNRKTYFVDVILPVPIHKAFTYRVPFELNEFIKEGVRVVVPFGRSKLQTGIITKIHENVPDYQVKYVESVLDEQPIITGKQFKLWSWMAEYYMAALGDVMNAALPSNFKLGSETKVVLHPDTEVNPDFLTDREYQIYEALQIQKELDLKEISEIVGIKTIQPIIKDLMEKRVIMTLEDVQEKYTPKTQIFIELTSEYQQEDKLKALMDAYSTDKKKSKQLDVILLLIQIGGPSQSALRSELTDKGASVSALNTLEKNGVLVAQRREVSRIELEDAKISQSKTLSESQATALKEIKDLYTEKDIVLLHGVTGSGKTEIYVELIKEQLAQGKQVLFLLPEIALTTQLIQRLRKYFGAKVGVYHSRFNQNERIEIWNALLQNDTSQFQIILGARSSVFLPFRNLGLVIVDEEHESSFKQYDPSPRYNGRDVGIVLASMFKAKVLLGSATPAVETYYNATTGKYGLVSLKERFGNLMLPEILTANIKQEKKSKTMQSDFSSFLMDAMKEALDNREQIILFQNRRGYNPVWACEVCGWNPLCKNCDVSLTYHMHNNILKCHYCSYYEPPIGTCPKCNSNRLKMIGFGTEKIEDELTILFPGVRVERLDFDTTRKKNSYERILEDFDKGAIDILVGTQMVTKGLDFDNVSLVGILDAELLLKRPDFRANERSYQLMSQVAGRAGRKNKRGKVIIQTYDPDNWVIRHVIEHDYEGLYKHELIERKNYFYPPYYKLINITLKHRNPIELDVMSFELAEMMQQKFGTRVLGPEFPIVKRIQNYYLKSIRLKIEREASQSKVKEVLQQLIDDFYTKPRNKSIRLVIDVDPL